jgi:hypothetical protein
VARNNRDYKSRLKLSIDTLREPTYVFANEVCIDCSKDVVKKKRNRA